MYRFLKRNERSLQDVRSHPVAFPASLELLPDVHTKLRPLGDIFGGQAGSFTPLTERWVWHWFLPFLIGLRVVRAVRAVSRPTFTAGSTGRAIPPSTPSEHADKEAIETALTTLFGAFS